MKYLFALMLLLFVSCTSTKDISWTEENDYVIIQLTEINPQVETYYAEITLESGRRIAVELGLPDEGWKVQSKK
jgi:hypothetical protein